MLALFLWLAGVLGIGYEIVKHDLWKTGIAAAGDLLFVAWVFLGGKLVVDGLRYGFGSAGIRRRSRGRASIPVGESASTQAEPGKAEPPRVVGK